MLNNCNLVNKLRWQTVKFLLEIFIKSRFGFKTTLKSKINNTGRRILRQNLFKMLNTVSVSIFVEIGVEVFIKGDAEIGFAYF